MFKAYPKSVGSKAGPWGCPKSLRQPNSLISVHFEKISVLTSLFYCLIEALLGFSLNLGKVAQTRFPTSPKLLFSSYLSPLIIFFIFSVRVS